MARTLPERPQKDIGSDLIMEKLVCDRLSFERDGFRQEGVETKINFSYAVNKDGDGEYRGTFVLTAIRENEYAASVQLTGYFSIDENNASKDSLLEKNGMAIIFPYARAQMTLLTSQPEIDPVVLPIVNINKIMEKTDASDNKE